MSTVFNKEIGRAIGWLYDTQNTENFGWSWVADISPNVQNTSEVVYALSLFPDRLTKENIEYLNEAVEYWLLYPSMHAFITVDWVWVIIALLEYLKNWERFNPPELSAVEANYRDYRRLHMNKIDAAIKYCVDRILQNQNEDGGWADYRGDNSTVARTSLVIYAFSLLADREKTEGSRQRAISWLLGLQNEDGGWGNVRAGSLRQNQFYGNRDIKLRTIDEQFLSSAAATGYAMLALSSEDKFRYRPELMRAESCLSKLMRADGRYDIFYEIGIKREAVFTFRHFGTAWAVISLLRLNDYSVVSEQIIKSVKYILCLQDSVSGGFRCSEGSDVYTWSTCNALMVLRRVSDAIGELTALDYIDILVDYIRNSGNAPRGGGEA